MLKKLIFQLNLLCGASGTTSFSRQLYVASVEELEMSLVNLKIVFYNVNIAEKSSSG